MLIELISSPEHEVLKVSYCDSAVSVVWRALSIVNFFCVRSRGHIFSLVVMKLGHVGSKTRSLGQILENFVYILEATLIF